MKTSTHALVKAMFRLSDDIDSTDGVPNAAIHEAALRLQEQEVHIKRLEDAGENLDTSLASFGVPIEGARLAWRKAKEDKL